MVSLYIETGERIYIPIGTFRDATFWQMKKQMGLGFAMFGHAVARMPGGAEERVSGYVYKNAAGRRFFADSDKIQQPPLYDSLICSTGTESEP